MASTGDCRDGVCASGGADGAGDGEGAVATVMTG